MGFANRLWVGSAGAALCAAVAVAAQPLPVVSTWSPESCTTLTEAMYVHVVWDAVPGQQLLASLEGTPPEGPQPALWTLSQYAARIKMPNGTLLTAVTTTTHATARAEADSLGEWCGSVRAEGFADTSQPPPTDLPISPIAFSIRAAPAPLPPASEVTFIGHDSAHAMSGAIATGELDTTGAHLIALCVSDYLAGPGVTVSDTFKNTYTALTAYTHTTGNLRTRLYYALNPTVGPKHRTVVTGQSVYAAISRAVFRGVLSYNLDVTGFNNFQTFVGGALSPGSLDVPANGVAISCVGTPYGQATTTWAIDDSFTLTNQWHQASVTEGVALAYRIIGTQPVNVHPLWRANLGSVTGAATIASFRGPM